VPAWSFLTNHARVLICIASDPDIRLRDVALKLGLTERGVYQVVVELVEGGYVVKERVGRRNRYHLHDNLPIGDPTTRERTIGELLDLLMGPTERGR